MGVSSSPAPAVQLMTHKWILKLIWQVTDRLHLRANTRPWWGQHVKKVGWYKNVSSWNKVCNSHWLRRDPCKLCCLFSSPDILWNLNMSLTFIQLAHILNGILPEYSQWKCWYELNLKYSELHSDGISQNILYEQINPWKHILCTNRFTDRKKD